MKNRDLFYDGKVVFNKIFFFSLFFVFSSLLCAQEVPDSYSPSPSPTPIETTQLNTIKYGTETEIANLIQTLKSEGTDFLDNDIITLVDKTRNQRILAGAFSFFSERGKSGLEDRAIRAIEERDDEKNETILAAIEYLGKVKAASAAPVLQKLLESGERRYMNTAFRAYGQVGAAKDTGNSAVSDDAAEYLIDFYQNRDPGDENRREVITALGAIGSPKAIEFLAGIAGNSEERGPLRTVALESIAQINEAAPDSGGLDAVLAGVSAADANVRATAVAALGPFSGSAVDEAILDAFRDSNYRSRSAAAQASGKRKMADAVPYLKFRAEKDEVPAVKDDAIRALGAIADSESLAILETFFTDRKNSERVRMVAGEMLMENQPERFLDSFIVEMDEAKQKSQTALYNGLLKIIGNTKSSNIEAITRRLMEYNGVVEKSYALDMAVNNQLTSLAPEIRTIADGKHESLAAKARRTMEKLGL